MLSEDNIGRARQPLSVKAETKAHGKESPAES
jgi:hypothetical protein